MSKTVVVSSLPNCDICKTPNVASYDARTIFGPWAYLCESHFESHGMGLGTGNGQKLILRISENT